MTEIVENPRTRHDRESNILMDDDDPGFTTYALEQLSNGAEGRQAIAVMQTQLCEELDKIVADLAVKLTKKRAATGEVSSTSPETRQSIAQLSAASKKVQQASEQTRALAQQILMAALMDGIKNPERADAQVGSADRYGILGALLEHAPGPTPQA